MKSCMGRAWYPCFLIQAHHFNHKNLDGCNYLAFACAYGHVHWFLLVQLKTNPLRTLFFFKNRRAVIIYSTWIHFGSHYYFPLPATSLTYQATNVIFNFINNLFAILWVFSARCKLRSELGKKTLSLLSEHISHGLQEIWTPVCRTVLIQRLDIEYTTNKHTQTLCNKFN